MKTEILKIDENNIDFEKIKYAAKVLKEGGLVVFPTETVYGLGADALNGKAVLKIFEAKGRPSDNPLIVHIACKEEIYNLMVDIPCDALKLMDKFWPGPLTLVGKKTSNVPDSVTAGLDTVAVRMPKNKIALSLIEEAKLPVAAPSANLSGRPSPTTAKHVIDDLNGRVDVIIEAGNSDIGVESTVLDITLWPPVILRPGGVSKEQLEEFLGKVDVDPSLTEKDLDGLIPKSPGMKYKHYSPKAELIVVEGEVSDVVGKINAIAGEYKEKGLSVGVLSTEQTKNLYNGAVVISLGDRLEPETIASNLFKALRDFDDLGVQIILAEAIDDKGIGFAVMNRMRKAAGYKIIHI
ncbi:L-threonylcarbamoyladenylate synthase [Acetivibrio saccincola]|uniref:Threonylcarbamoyl-AMP synthase n=1 Tax=Acetivibrio saccincola TaxID=1677857 RepID=A0A2K9EFT2_9FIRM|nr:L-threonylcarbamoyladenylate synthase [Acetivibrio saccincola]AUG59004.1 Threonylcarbamoyl-AMP synthase [Acetivibrio saccincola]NLW27785.1 threonylcarbamoyl-AMP synthase [Acetivibrio saccincola]HQD28232.1 L-threonylcarbamoyladenylate synthase [Acetivibrio saccincola]